MNPYKNLKIFITGINGFQGIWLALFLKKCNAKVSRIGLKEYNFKIFKKLLSKNIENILILTSKNNFFLKSLLSKISNNKDYNFFLINEYDNFSNISNKLCIQHFTNNKTKKCYE